MTDQIIVDDQGRPEPPVAADEAGTMLGFLDFQRATLAWKTSGLDAAALNVKVAASSMTLGGILKHMAYVEDGWFSIRLHGRDPAPALPRNSPQFKADLDWEWHSAASDTPDQLRSLWQDSVARSRATAAETIASSGLGKLSEHVFDDGSRVSLRWIVVHMIEEYARHNGHADLIREAIDGATGE